MKIAFFGTPDFAAQILESLLPEFPIVAVVTQPDKPQGRGGHVQPPAVKEVALKHNLPLFQPAKASDPVFIEELAKLQPDILVVVAYGHILRQKLLDLAPAINVHASLLPHLRGAAPIQWALIQGDKESGVTIMKMSLGMDEGDMLLQRSCPIDSSWDAEDLRQALIPLAKEALLTVLHTTPPGVPQNHALATYAPKLEAEEAFIDFNGAAEVVYNRIRGCNPEPGSWAKIAIKGKSKKLKIIKSLIINDLRSNSPGTILQWDKKEGIVVGCSVGAIKLIKIQLEGKKTCDATAFTLGYCKNDVTFDLRKP